MTLEARDQSPAVTMHELLPVDDLILLQEAAIGSEAEIGVIKREGEEYGSTVIVSRHFGKERRVVPEGQILISIRTAAQNFSRIFREFKDLKEARAEKATS